MRDAVTHGWAKVYPHLGYKSPLVAIAWLGRAFAFTEKVRMERPDGSFITAKLETPGGGLVMVTGHSPDTIEWIRGRVPNFREPREDPWPLPMHAITVVVDDVDAHFRRAKQAGASTLMEPRDQPWGLRSYAAIDLEGHQWEFSQVMRLVEPEEWGARRIA